MFLLPEVYGKGTAAMRELLAETSNISLRDATLPSCELEARTGIWEFIEHAKRYDDNLARLGATNVRVVGDLIDLHVNIYGIDAYSPFDPSIYRLSNAITRMVVEGEDAVLRTQHLKSLVLPPLWPIPGNPSVRGGLFVATREHLAADKIEYGSRDWVVAWAMLCDAEDAVWGAVA